MSIRNFICPDNGTIPVQDCLKEGGCRMGDRCATRSYLRMCSKERSHYLRCLACGDTEVYPPNTRLWETSCKCGDKHVYIPSTTQLIAGTKFAFLKLTNEYDVSPDARAYMINGTKAHNNLEGNEDEYSLLEEKFLESDVSGISDVIENEDGLITLADYKTTGSFKCAKALGFYVDEEKTGEVFKSGKRKGEEKTRKVLKRDESKRDVEDWAWQLNKYRREYEKKSGNKVDRLKIQAVVRDGGTYISRSRGVFRNIYYFQIPILPDDVVDSYFSNKRSQLFQALKQGYWNEVCSSKECWDGIKCERYCEVAEYCSQGKYLKKERTEEMPIQGLSEARRLPRMGKIRLGIMKKTATGKEYPSEVNYFILDPAVENEMENKKLVDVFQKKYGEKPTSIPIMFPIADKEQVFPQYYKSYGASTMLNCKGDGIEATTNNPEYISKLKVIRDGEMGKVVKCEGQKCPYYISKKCTECATLSVLLPELPGAGVWQITTGSYNSIVNLNSCFDYIRAVAGRFHMIPLKLQRREQEIAHEGKRTKHYILHVDMEATLADLQRLATIDPERITMDLPAIEDEKKDLYLEHNEDINPANEVVKPQAEAAKPAQEAKPTQETKPDTVKPKAEDAEIVNQQPADFVEGIVTDIKEWKVKQGGKEGVPLYGTTIKNVMCITFDENIAKSLKESMGKNVWLIYQKKINPANNKPYNDLIEVKLMEKTEETPY